MNSITIVVPPTSLRCFTEYLYRPDHIATFVDNCGLWWNYYYVRHGDRPIVADDLVVEGTWLVFIAVYLGLPEIEVHISGRTNPCPANLTQVSP